MQTGEQRKVASLPSDGHSLDNGSPRAGSASSASSSVASSPKVYRSIDALLGLGCPEPFGIVGGDVSPIGNGKDAWCVSILAAMIDTCQLA